jgi:hypothetical protein
MESAFRSRKIACEGRRKRELNHTVQILLTKRINTQVRCQPRVNEAWLARAVDRARAARRTLANVR